MTADAHVAHDARVDPCDRTVGDQLDGAGAGGKGARNCRRGVRGAGGERACLQPVAPFDGVRNASGRPQPHMNRRRLADAAGECEAIRAARHDAWNDVAPVDIELLRGRRSLRAAGAGLEVEAIRGDVGPLPADERR